jgi:hypothetical protein
MGPRRTLMGARPAAACGDRRGRPCRAYRSGEHCHVVDTMVAAPFTKDVGVRDTPLASVLATSAHTLVVRGGAGADLRRGSRDRSILAVATHFAGKPARRSARRWLTARSCRRSRTSRRREKLLAREGSHHAGAMDHRRLEDIDHALGMLWDLRRREYLVELTPSGSWA